MNPIRARNFTGFTALAISAGDVTPFTGLTGATIALLTFESSAVRIRFDNVTAHSGTGHLFTASQRLDVEGSDVLKNMHIISTAPTGIIQASIGYQ